MPAGRQDLSEWRPIRKIGEGSQGSAMLVQNYRTGELAVRKRSREFKMLGQISLEEVILMEILPSSRRINQMIHCALVEDPGGWNLFQLFEYCPGGDLYHAISGYGRLSEDFIWHCFSQLAHALDVIHNRGSQPVVHRDIKPDNIFLDKKYRHRAPWPNLKLGDFGLATLEKHTAEVHVPAYHGPEIPHQSPAGDVWSLGAVIHWLVHRLPPTIPRPAGFPGLQQEWELLPEARVPQKLPRCYSVELNGYMMACLEWDPRARITSRELEGRLTGLARR